MISVFHIRPGAWFQHMLPRFLIVYHCIRVYDVVCSLELMICSLEQVLFLSKIIYNVCSRCASYWPFDGLFFHQAGKD